MITMLHEMIIDNPNANNLGISIYPITMDDDDHHNDDDDEQQMIG